MNALLLRRGPAFWTLCAAILLAVSMPFSPFLLSIGMWCLVAAGLWEAALRSPKKKWWQVLWFSWRRFTAQPPYFWLSLLFWVVALSGLWSEDSAFWLQRLRIRIPFLVLPWAFANLPSLSLRQWSVVMYALTPALSLLSLGVLTNFALDPETILKGLQEGQPVPAPRHHIRYSLMLVVALLAGGWLWTQKNYWSTRTERLVFGALLLFLGISLHLLTVRSALVAFYLALLFTLLRYWWQSKNWKLGLLGLCLLVLAPLIAVTQVKSVQNRLAYMRYDWEHFRSAKGGENYSDAERFVSLEVGVRLWLEQPLLGVGMGDLERETQKMTDRIHPEYSETPKLPHNQIIYILAGTGLLGLLLSMWAWLYPLWFKTYRRSYLFMVFQVVVLVSFLVEYTFETSIGTAFCLFYQLWTMKMAECLEAGLSPLEAKPGV